MFAGVKTAVRGDGEAPKVGADCPIGLRYEVFDLPLSLYDKIYCGRLYAAYGEFFSIHGSIEPRKIDAQEPISTLSA